MIVGRIRSRLANAGWPAIVFGSTLAGALWGAHARIWMRFITADPEFTWSGTLFIVGGFTVAAVMQAILFLARRSGLRRRLLTPLRVLGLVSLLPLGIGAGSVMLGPTLVAATAVGHRQWPRAARLLLFGVTAIGFVAVAASLYRDLDPIRSTAGVVWMAVLYAVIVWAALATFGAQFDGWTAPRWLFKLGLAAAALGGLSQFALLGAS